MDSTGLRGDDPSHPPMDDNDWLARRFEQNRPRLRAVAYRMLGSAAEADDAVQEAWIRVSRAGADDVENLGGWLTTIIARVSLNMLESRASRREEPIESAVGHAQGPDPEQEAVLADSVGAALLVVLDTLTPAERLAFVLHDMFAVSFDEIAPIVDRSPAAARQLASRARRRVRGSDVPHDQDRQREVVGAFLAASRKGDFGALIAMLDPDIVLRSDEAAVLMGADAEIRGAQAVAATFAGRAQAARPAVIDGAAGLVWSQAGRIRVVFSLTISGGQITAIDLIADAGRIGQLDVQYS